MLMQHFPLISSPYISIMLVQYQRSLKNSLSARSFKLNFSQTHIFSNLLQSHAGHIVFKQQSQSGDPHTKLGQACGVMAEDKKHIYPRKTRCNFGHRTP